jgi:regulator of PEP synthase PpsR (kinase-PPPase family)
MESFMKRKQDAAAKNRGTPKTIYLIAEGTGETISKIARAALAQFDTKNVRIKKFFQITTKNQIEDITELASKDKALLAFSIVETALSEFLRGETNRRRIKAIDVIRDFIVQLSMFLGEAPVEIPGRQHVLDEEYFRRIEAINFAVKHDDGKAPNGLKLADLVLVGLSRTGKTPLATYLAHQGWKVANVPLHPDMDAPAELFEVEPRKVFGLMINVENLVKVREARLQQLGLAADAKYADPVKITDELDWCEDFYHRHPRWHVVDISNKAIEEVSASVLNLYHK